MAGISGTSSISGLASFKPNKVQKALLSPITDTVVIGAIGQSNMASRATYTTGDTYPAGVYEYNQSSTTVSIEGETNIETTDSNDLHLSLTCEFAVQFMADNPSATLIFVGHAVGGTGFATDRWNQGDDLYEAAVSRINAALAANSGSIFGGWLWHQGENDAVQAASSTYKASLKAMITALRSDVNGATDSSPFVCGEIREQDAERIAINQAMRDAEDEMEYMTATQANDLSGQGDGVHFNEAAQRTLGGRYYTNWKSAVSNLPGTAT